MSPLVPLLCMGACLLAVILYGAFGH